MESTSPLSPTAPPEGVRVLGIDGGGTKTEWLVGRVTVGGELAAERSGVLPASNLRLTSDEKLLALFSVLPRDVSHVGVFLAGCASDADRARLRQLAARAWPEAAVACGSDRDSALATAFREGDGIIVIAGTGAVVHGRHGTRIAKAGGWGQLLGDRGGGYHLAMQALRYVLTHFDLEGEVCSLARDILQVLALNRLEDLVDWVMAADKMSVARLAPAVFDAAERGEVEASAILESGAAVLADFARVVAKRLEFAAPRVRLFGGLFVHRPQYAHFFERELLKACANADIAVCAESGAIGAARLALERNTERPVTFTVEPAAEVGSGERASLAAALTEQTNPRSSDLDRKSTHELIDLFITEEVAMPEALSACREPLAAAVEVISAALAAGCRLFYVGAGTSGRLGVLDASEIPPTFGAPPDLVQGIMAGGAIALHRAVEGAEDQAEGGALAVSERGVGPGDVVCGITASGRTPFALGALARARALSAHTLLLTCNPARVRSTPPWDVEIDLPVGPEIVTGSTRLKAGTATKLALNILSTCAMIRLGKVKGNAMVDLHISNGKLRDRGVRLVQDALGIGYEEARARLVHEGWNVRKCLEQR